MGIWPLRENESLRLSTFYLVRDGGYGAILLLGLLYLRLPIKELGQRNFAWKDVRLGLFAAVIAHFAFDGLSRLLHFHATATSRWDDYYEGSARGVAAVLLVLMIGIISPIVQELYFRGALMKALRGFMPTAAAVVLSSLVFGVWHNLGGIEQMSFAFFTGIVAALLFVRTRRLTASCTMHIALNCYFMYWAFSTYR